MAEVLFYMKSLIIEEKQLRAGESFSGGEGGKRVISNTVSFSAVVHYDSADCSPYKTMQIHCNSILESGHSVLQFALLFAVILSFIMRS